MTGWKHIRGVVIAAGLGVASAASGEPGTTVTICRDAEASEVVERRGPPVPCNILIRYDDGTDDFDGIGRTLGGPNNETQGIWASPPTEPETWLVQSAGFFADFWAEPGIVNVVVRDRAVPALSTSEPIFVDDGGIWEVAFSEPVCVVGDFDVILCPEPGVRGVTGEDIADIDVRSFHTLAACANATPIHNLDLMIWACVTPCGPVPTAPLTWGAIKSRFP